MHEVISFSCSNSAGHLITQLYNVQETHLPYKKNQELKHQNDIFLMPRAMNGRFNYYPRGIDVEFSGGFGALGKHDYQGAANKQELLPNVHVVKKERRPKTEYQQRLDAGQVARASLLNASNTTYWTDYNRLIYQPDSLVELPNFQHPNGSHKNFPRLHFDSFGVGEAEFRGICEDIDDTFRKCLESSDQLQGVNFFAECDNAWGGFTHELMLLLKDEYFSNGVSSKYNFWVYGLLNTPQFDTSNSQQPEKRSRLDVTLSRIKSFVELGMESTLFIPLDTPEPSGTLLNSQFNSASRWHCGAAQAMFVNSIWGLNCQVESPVNMATIEDNLLRGNSKRNIVNEVFLESVVEQKPRYKDTRVDSFGIESMSQDANVAELYLNCGNSAQDSSTVRLGLASGPSTEVFSRGYVSKLGRDDLKSNEESYVNSYMNEITKSSSFPPIVDDGVEFGVQFGQSSKLSFLLKEHRKIVQRLKAPHHIDMIGDKAELVESISTLIEEYSSSYSTESDYDD